MKPINYVFRLLCYMMDRILLPFFGVMIELLYYTSTLEIACWYNELRVSFTDVDHLFDEHGI